MATSKPRIYIRERVYIPIKYVRDKEDLKESYTKRFFDDKACKTCDYLPERFSDMCEVCPAYKGTVKLYSFKNERGINYVGLPVGDKRNIEKYAGIVFEDFKIVDVRKVVPFDYKIRFTIQLRPHQKKLVTTFLNKAYGLLEAPPRFGKTVCMLSISVTLGNKTLVLASQHEFLQQYIYHIEGNEQKGIPKCTNLPELQLKTKKKLYGFPKTDADFKNFQIFTMTYHQFMDEVSGKNRFKKIMPYIGMVQVDECFTYAHEVETEMGRVQLGDIVSGKSEARQVLSRNIKLGVDAFKPIESVTRKTTRKLCRVMIDGVPFVCTPSHLFWSQDRNEYVEAQHLKPNERIMERSSASL